MDSEPDIDQLAHLYDLFAHAFDIESSEAKQAESDFYRILDDLYEVHCPEGRPAFHDFRREIVRKCEAWLRKN